MSQAKSAGPSLARHLMTQSMGDVSSETRRTTSRAAELRAWKTSQAIWAGPSLARHLGAQSLEDISSETGWTTSRAASEGSEFRGCLRRNGLDHLLRGIWELR
eukprot:6578857-Pyramimonas_sp.AAC.1